MDTNKGHTVPVAIGEELIRDAMSLHPIIAQMSGDYMREQEIRGKMRRGEHLTVEDGLFLRKREQERAERSRLAEERAREARDNALTVRQLVEVLRGLPQDAPVSVSEVWYDEAETVWADEHIADLRSDGSVHVGG